MKRLLAELGIWFIVFCLVIFLIDQFFLEESSKASNFKESNQEKKEDFPDVFIVPSPTAIILGGIGIITVGWLRQKKILR